ncbi:MAG: universal stress protein [Pseudomonadales bacterium]|nr:universal stress protein [Pseudomonadales bacterium]MCP5182640.1 universal stress protein [Pseudomonadales bacterium]
MAYQRILVSVDLTEEADEVISAASNIAKSQNAVMHSVTVVKPLARVYGGLDMAPITSGAIAFEKEAIEQAGHQLRELGGEYGVPDANSHVRLGSPPAEIRALAEELGIDLIVIGTHGRHGLGLLLGSTANAVLHGVTCDVLAVKIHPVVVS